jgi:hypothetical protein
MPSPISVTTLEAVMNKIKAIKIYGALFIVW